MCLLKLRLQRRELPVRQPRPVLGAVNQRPRRPSRIVQQRLVPGPRRIVHVDGEGRRLHRALAVPVVARIEELQVQHRREPVRMPHHPRRPPGHLILIAGRPAVRPGNHPHPVGPQRIQLLRRPLAVIDGFQIGVPRRLQRAIDLLQQIPRPLLRIGPRQQRRQRMLTPRLVAPVEHDQRHARRRLGHQPHTAIGHRVLGEPLLGQTQIVPRRPHRPPPLRQRDQRPHRRRLLLQGGHKGPPAPQGPSPIEHLGSNSITSPRPQGRGEDRRAPARQEGATPAYPPERRVCTAMWIVPSTPSISSRTSQALTRKTTIPRNPSHALRLASRLACSGQA